MNTASKSKYISRIISTIVFVLELYSKYLEQLQFNRLRLLTRSTASFIFVGNEKKVFNRKITTKIKNEQSYNSCSSVVGYLEILSQI